MGAANRRSQEVVMLNVFVASASTKTIILGQIHSWNLHGAERPAQLMREVTKARNQNQADSGRRYSKFPSNLTLFSDLHIENRLKYSKELVIFLWIEAPIAGEKKKKNHTHIHTHTDTKKTPKHIDYLFKRAKHSTKELLSFILFPADLKKKGGGGSTE